MADKYDIHFQPVPVSDVTGFQCFEFGYESPLKVKGLQALVNRWVKTFMTPKGSDLLYPEAGTAFGNLPGSNVGHATSDLSDMVAVAVDEASEQVKEQDIEGLYSLEEQLQSATLMDFQEEVDGIQVWVLIKNMAGDALPILTTTL